MGEFTEEPSIQSIVIGDRAIEISYSELRDQTKHVMEVRTIAVDISQVEEEFSDLLDSANAVLDAILLLRRSSDPPKGRTPE